MVSLPLTMMDARNQEHQAARDEASAGGEAESRSSMNRRVANRFFVSLGLLVLGHVLPLILASGGRGVSLATVLLLLLAAFAALPLLFVMLLITLANW